MTSGGCDLDHSSNSAASLWLTFKPAISSNLFLSTAPCCVLVACTQPEIELHRQSGCFIGNIAGRGYVARLWSSHVHLTAVTHMPRSPAPPPPLSQLFILQTINIWGLERRLSLFSGARTHNSKLFCYKVELR